jgi:REP element-mobilizing transposase RayT
VNNGPNLKERQVENLPHNIMMKEQFRRRRLPHLDKPGAIYFVTACLDGSIPARGLIDIADYRKSLDARQRPSELTQQEWETRKWKLVFGRSDDWLDRNPVVRFLEDNALAEEVENALLHFAGERYAIWAWTVMPSHFHFVFEPLPTWVASLGESVNERTPRERIMHSVKRHSGLQCNRIRSKTGAFWQDESYDHCVDNVDELGRTIDYVELNPEKAGIVARKEDHRFSSSYYRNQNLIPIGRPLIGETQLNALDSGVGF